MWYTMKQKSLDRQSRKQNANSLREKADRPMDLVLELAAKT